jgi:hypothetical protein
VLALEPAAVAPQRGDEARVLEGPRMERVGEVPNGLGQVYRAGLQLGNLLTHGGWCNVGEAVAKVAQRDGLCGQLLIHVIVQVGAATLLTDWVSEVPPGDLKVRNETALLAMGVSQEAVDHLLRHRWYTLTLQTGLVRGLERLSGVTGRPDVMPLALTVESEEQARFVVGSLGMLARYHETVGPLSRLEVRGTVLGWTKADQLVVAAPVDHVAWTARLHRFVSREDLAAKERSLWLSGQLTPLARQKLTEAGWSLHERAPAAAQ